ncbi:hypothetical protein BRYFOR_09043 [Marvinbryantia formatexigens DSM 14469]|uniref:Uncharacterized protein n=1 Tax=Marvinbryantia formatexigens DSM 14469 TaxID=478749 RepID=C6LK56_9FIRM|nr:hypothetical protein [Marvinbryantia formatexigens]EET58937.1 hypothetical protein BRYFOR_09043 [Marvinbryantia formatexigens DSM 14469]
MRQCSNEKRDFNQYLTYIHNQVRELQSQVIISNRLDVTWK